jgi:quinol monooxygenase YgiN
MALLPLADEGHFLHVYDFKVQPGRGDEFIKLFNDFDYSDDNLMHRSAAQVKDGVLCRDTADPDHFWLIGEWRSVEEHRALLQELRTRLAPKFISLITDGKFVPLYGKVVSSTPAEYLAKFSRT